MVLAACIIFPDLYAHPEDEGGPLIELQIQIHDTDVTTIATLPAEFFLDEVVQTASLATYRDISSNTVKDRILKWFINSNPVTVDGLQVYPIFTEVKMNVPEGWIDLIAQTPSMMALARVSVALRYETKAIPEQFTFLWKRYIKLNAIQGGSSARAVKVPVLGVLTVGEHTRLLSFTEQNPEYIWHRNAAAPDFGDVVKISEPEAIKIHVPVLSVIFLLLALLALPILQRHSVRAWRRWGIPVGGLLLAIILWPATRLEIETPWKASVQIPDQDTAIIIFQTLQRNIYRAFDYDSDEAIYDTLAHSVAGPELDGIYNDVYESLIMREEGGAVARVQDVTYIETRLLKNTTKDNSPDSRGFSIYCHWRVHGIVRHWGHTHERVNEFEAEYDLEPNEGQWKIVNSRILTQKRVPADETGN